MKLTEAYQILKQHNHWRRCDDEQCDCVMGEPAEIGKAIDVVLEALEKPVKFLKILQRISL